MEVRKSLLEGYFSFAKGDCTADHLVPLPCAFGSRAPWEATRETHFAGSYLRISTNPERWMGANPPSEGRHWREQGRWLPHGEAAEGASRSERKCMLRCWFVFKWKPKRHLPFVGLPQKEKNNVVCLRMVVKVACVPVASPKTALPKSNHLFLDPLPTATRPRVVSLNKASGKVRPAWLGQFEPIGRHFDNWARQVGQPPRLDVPITSILASSNDGSCEFRAGRAL